MAPATAARVLPHANTKMAQYLTKQIDALKGEVSQREIAAALGYERPNIISMFKTGESKVPFDKIPDLAKVLRVDVGHLMRLGLEQYWPDKMRVINEVFSRIVTAHEMELVEIFRKATGDADPKLTEEQRMTLRKLFKSR
jgi:predicted XRE-type DNA-binding protein